MPLAQLHHPAVTLLIFLALLSVLVLAHELGHFVLAKRAGILVQEFGFGYPPRLFGVRRGETLYSLNLLPLGGFVKLLGENGTPGEPRSFASQSLGTRAAVLAAGAGMNLLLAPLFLAGALALGQPGPCTACGRVQVVGVQSGGPADQAGLRAGDVLVRFAGQPVATVDEVRAALDGVSTPTAGVPLVLLRGGQEVQALLPAALAEDGRQRLGVTLGPPLVTRRPPLWQVLPLGVQQTVTLVRDFFTDLGPLVTGTEPVEIAGPVGIARLTGQVAQTGWPSLLRFAALLSVNLGLVNLLPFPALDGARIAFVGLEAFRRGQRLRPRLEARIHLAGMALLLGLMVLVSYHDVRALLPG